LEDRPIDDAQESGFAGGEAFAHHVPGRVERDRLPPEARQVTDETGRHRKLVCRLLGQTSERARLGHDHEATPVRR
jgi:hypothetical protein